MTFDAGSTFTVAGVDGCSIPQVPERTRFPASTLRLSERSGLVRPKRTPAGHRSYDECHIELLAFIGRATTEGPGLVGTGS